jgi:hypothetical protein
MTGNGTKRKLPTFGQLVSNAGFCGPSTRTILPDNRFTATFHICQFKMGNLARLNCLWPHALAGEILIAMVERSL